MIGFGSRLADLMGRGKKDLWRPQVMPGGSQVGESVYAGTPENLNLDQYNPNPNLPTRGMPIGPTNFKPYNPVMNQPGNQMQGIIGASGRQPSINNFQPQSQIQPQPQAQSRGFLNRFKPPGMPAMSSNGPKLPIPGGLRKTLNKGPGGFNPVRSMFSRFF